MGDGNKGVWRHVGRVMVIFGRKGEGYSFTEEVTYVWSTRDQKESVSLERAQLAEGTACTKAQRHVTGTASRPFGLL